MAVTKQFRKFIPAVGVSILFFATIHVLKPIRFSDYSSISQQLYSNLTHSEEKNVVTHGPIILFWSKFFRRPYRLPDRNTPCLKGCHIFHEERAVYPISDALIFHSNDLFHNGTDFPPTRVRNQIWLFLELESPVLMERKDLEQGKFDKLFNWTMSYRRDADIYWAYMKTHLKGSKVNWTMSSTALQQKTKLVAWMVSHCSTASKREDYVKELQRYIPVDIYGKCGNLSCNSSVALDCMKNFGKEYKFYLSFENAFCKDYVTEKLLNALESNLLPVVMGGKDYKDIAPPNSYINIDDFESPKKLAEYLKFLDKNPEKYLKYFEWKTSYTVKGGTIDAWCDLCSKLIQHKRKPMQQTYYSKLWNWLYYGSDSDYSSSMQPVCDSPNFKF